MLISVRQDILITVGSFVSVGAIYNYHCETDCNSRVLVLKDETITLLTLSSYPLKSLRNLKLRTIVIQFPALIWSLHDGLHAVISPGKNFLQINDSAQKLI